MRFLDSILLASHPRLLSPVLQIVHRVGATYLSKQSELKRRDPRVIVHLAGRRAREFLAFMLAVMERRIGRQRDCRHRKRGTGTWHWCANHEAPGLADAAVSVAEDRRALMTRESLRIDRGALA